MPGGPQGGPECFDEIDSDPVSARDRCKSEVISYREGSWFGQIRGQNFRTLTPYNFGTPYPNHTEFILKTTCEKQIFPMVKVSNRSEFV